MRTWIIRKQDLSISGPMPESILVSKIESGEVTPQDELCPGNGYWFSIQEVEEVRAHFGEIRLKALMPSDSAEITNTMNAVSAQGRTSQKREFASVDATRKVGTYPQLKLVPEVEPSPSRLFYGIFLGLIFLGTLVMLWLGSR